jgi:hypothetical protein
MKTVLAGAFLLASALVATQAAAGTITFEPGSNGAVAVSPPFGALAAGGTLGTNYINFGVDFSYGGVEGIFNDTPLAFAGVNGSNKLDLLSPVDGRIVVPGSLNQGVTDFFSAEAGFAANGTLELSVFGLTGNLLATAFNGLPLGPDNRTTFSISTPGIAFFLISDPGADTFGVDQIILDTPVAATPLPSTWTMLIAGFVGLGFFAYRGSKKNTGALAAG